MNPAFLFMFALGSTTPAKVVTDVKNNTVLLDIDCGSKRTLLNTSTIANISTYNDKGSITLINGGHCDLNITLEQFMERYLTKVKQ